MLPGATKGESSSIPTLPPPPLSFTGPLVTGGAASGAGRLGYSGVPQQALVSGSGRSWRAWAEVIAIRPEVL
jgi:hypothetical protein